MKRTVSAAVTFAALIALPQLAAAVPVTITATNVWRADRMPNPIGFLPTSFVPWIEVSTDSSGNVADTIVTASVGLNTYTLSRIPTGLLQGTYFAQIPYDATFTGDWTITARNGDNVSTTTRPGFSTSAMPFVSDIGFTGTGTDINVHWTVSPEGQSRLETQQVSIWDLSSNPTPTTVRFFAIGTGPRQIDLSTLGLDPGTAYAVEINNVSRNPLTGFIDAFSGNWLSGWTPTPDGPVQLPVEVPEPGTLLLVTIALGGMGLMHRRRKAGAA